MPTCPGQASAKLPPTACPFSDALMLCTLPACGHFSPPGISMVRGGDSECALVHDTCTSTALHFPPDGLAGEKLPSALPKTVPVNAGKNPCFYGAKTNKKSPNSNFSVMIFQNKVSKMSQVASGVHLSRAQGGKQLSSSCARAQHPARALSCTEARRPVSKIPVCSEHQPRTGDFLTPTQDNTRLPSGLHRAHAGVQASTEGRAQGVLGAPGEVLGEG